MATDDMEIIHSPLEQTYSAEGHTLCIQIYLLLVHHLLHLLLILLHQFSLQYFQLQ